MNRLITVTIAVFIWSLGYSQNLADINWVFGDSCGLNFSSGEPVFFETAVVCYESSASISDTDGNLLFYTNGQNVWNRENEVMPNGDGLNVVATDSSFGTSTTQAVIIVPKPGTEDVYYIFQLLTNKAEYSIVDANLDLGKGDIIEKNEIIYEHTLTEKMQVVKHANGRDWWLILRTYPDYYIGDTTYSFVTFLITPFTIEGPFIQVYGLVTDIDNCGTTGQMKFNRQGTMAVLTTGDNADLYDFDRCTGLFSNQQVIENITTQNTYGAEFSPDGSKLYIGINVNGSLAYIYQYCLNCDEELSETQKVIYHNTYGHDYNLFQLQIAPNNKIYSAFAYWGVPNYIFSPQTMNLNVINNPNNEGAACDFDTLTISLTPKRTIGNLPNMPNYNLGALIGSGCDTITAIDNITPTENLISIYPNPATTFLNISSNLNNYNNTTLTIYSLSGVKVKAAELTGSFQKVDIAELMPGLYTIIFTNENAYFYREKFLILK